MKVKELIEELTKLEEALGIEKPVHKSDPLDMTMKELKARDNDWPPYPQGQTNYG